MPQNPSLSWQKLHDVFYSIRTCYDSLPWSVEPLYSNFHVSVSPQTTLIALASKSVPHPNVIEVFSISGQRLWSLVYNSTPHDHIAGFCFYGELLCVVLSSGKLRLYTDFHGTFDEYPYSSGVVPLAAGADENGDNGGHLITNLETNETEEPSNILQTDVWGRFLVLRFVDRLSFTDLESFVTYRASFPALTAAKVYSAALLSAAENTLKCVLSYAKTVYTVTVDVGSATADFSDESITHGPFSLMAASANGNFLALLNPESLQIFVITTSFNRVLLEYDASNESSAPYMMEWAGNDALILSLRDEIKLIGPGQKSVSFFYDIVEDDFDFDRIRPEDSSFTVPIIKSQEDGLKIITQNKVEFLGRVPDPTVNLFSVGSTHPALILLECVDKLASHASKADSNISLLKADDSLGIAIRGCLDAALEEFSPVLQKKILKAVSFGKIYESLFNATQYLAVLNTLKVLNQLRSPEIGLFLTNSQVLQIGWPAVIDMLLRRSHYSLALEVVKLLQLKSSKSSVFVHWCCYKIRKELNMSDADLFKVVSKKLMLAQDSGPPKNYISVSEIMDVAFQEGRIELCKLLVTLEPSGFVRASQLLKMDEVELALSTCFQTCDYDLCKLLLLHLKDNSSLVSLLKILNQNEATSGIAKELAEDDDIRPFLRENLFISADVMGNFWENNIAVSDKKLLEAYYRIGGKTTKQQILNLKAAQRESSDSFEAVYKERKAQLTPLANNKSLRKMVQLELQLLESQMRLSETFQRSFFEEKSAIAIIRKLIGMHQLKPAAKVQKDFKIDTEKYWNLVLENYCKAGEFDRLNRFIKEANANGSVLRAPIGFDTIVKTCMAYGCPKHYISTYIGNCENTAAEKIDMYLKNEDMLSAAEEAYTSKDGDTLRRMQKMGPDGTVSDAIKTYLNRLGI